MNYKIDKKMNVGGYIAAAQSAKEIAPKSVDAIDEKIASRIKPKESPIYYNKGGKVYKRYIVHIGDSYDGDIIGSSDTFRGASMIMKKLEKKGAFEEASSWGVADTEDYFFRRKEENTEKMLNGGLAKSKHWFEGELSFLNY